MEIWELLGEFNIAHGSYKVMKMLTDDIDYSSLTNDDQLLVNVNLVYSAGDS